MTISDPETESSTVSGSESCGSSVLSSSTGSSSEEAPQIPRVIANWWLDESLGSGYSGSIFRATNVHTGQVVALKVQDVNHPCPTNRYERHIYPLIQGAKGMPKLWAAGVQGQWDYLAIDLLGVSLDSIYRKSGKNIMDLGSVCSIAIQVILRLELMHARGVLHRDIQLGNCVIGLPPHEKTIYMIDFGFSKRYIDPYTNRHIPDSKVKRDFIGNYWFSSINVHCRGKVPSRRDDLEAAALMFIHLLTPRGLSWTRNGVPKTSEAHNRLMAEKRSATPEDLCRGLPSVFEEFLRYCRRLKFKECPDYKWWAEQFRELAMEEGYSGSEDFVWPPVEPKISIQKTINTPRRCTPAINADEMAGILNDLKKLNLGERQVLADRTNVEEAVRKAKADALVESSGKSSDQKKDVITISSGSEGEVPSIPPPFLSPKAYKLEKLAKKTNAATDNAALSVCVVEFVEIMKLNSSRTLTKEAFHFLDVLYKQLADPSVFVQPLRTSRTRSINEPVEEKEPGHVKLGVVARLKREVGWANSNRVLATMVADFGKVTNRSTGRTVTKDGFAFLDGLSQRLKELS